MFLERHKRAARTLRFRLMVWNALVVLLTAVATLFGLREGVRFSLLHEMDQLLAEDLHEVRILLDEHSEIDLKAIYPDLDRKARSHAQHGWFVQLLDDQGTELWASTNTPIPHPKGGVSRELNPVTAGGIRMVQFKYNKSNHGPLVVRVGMSLDFLGNELSRIDRLVGLAAGMVLVIAPLCGYWLAGRATRPLAEMIQAGAHMQPSQFDQRLPIRGTGDELDQLASTINGLLNRIAKYVDEKRDFLADAAHELRTPLAAVRSSVEVALVGRRSAAEYEELLGELMEQTQSLEVLVNQLLLLAETDADRLKLHAEPVLLKQLVKQAIEMFRGAAEDQGLELVSDLSLQLGIEGHRHHLRQVINNLLDNALKFTASGGRVTVRLTRSSDHQSAVLAVSDTGQGIREEELPHVFNRFYRGDKARRREGRTRGTGLGLSICRAIVEAHGGTISVESLIDHGATFTVILPLVVDPAFETPHPAHSGS